MKKKEKRTGRSWRKKALTGILAVSMILQTSGMSLFAEENAGITKEAVLSESEVPAASAESVNQEAASDPGNTDVSVTEAPAEAVEGAETQEEVTTPDGSGNTGNSRRGYGPGNTGNFGRGYRAGNTGNSGRGYRAGNVGRAFCIRGFSGTFRCRNC